MTTARGMHRPVSPPPATQVSPGIHSADGLVHVYLRRCETDVNHDGATDLSDLATLLAAYGTTSGDPDYNADVDFDHDGDVDLSDLSALLRLILGGELTEYTEMMGKAREAATKRMLAQASEMGADAIINARYMTTSVIGSAAELLVYGTAVMVE